MAQAEWFTPEEDAGRGGWRMREGLRTVRGSAAVAVVLALLLLVSFFSVTYLPMVDLPQHAALIGAWVRMAAPESMESAMYTINWQTPYLTAYALCRAIASWASLPTSIKLVVWISCVGFQVAFALLVRQLRYPRWLVLLGVPLSVGYSFYFGFLSFLAAIPFALLSLWSALRYADRPSARRGVAVAAFLCATLLTHGFAAAIALMLTGPVLLGGRGSIVRRLLPALAPLILAALWLLPGPSVQSIGRTVWEPRLSALLHLPALLLATSESDRAAWFLGSGILLLVCLALGRPARPWRWLPFGALLLALCLFPAMHGGFAPTYPRFAAFVVPTLLVAFEPRSTPSRWRLPAIAIAATGCWFALFASRLSAFEKETATFRLLVERLPRGLDMRPVVFERNSAAFPGLPAMLHLPAYYAAQKGGFQGYSFAMYPTSVVRYTAAATPGMLGGAEWHPESFSIEDELPMYDVFVVHSSVDRSVELFGEHLGQMSLVFAEGAWRAYAVRER